MKVIALTVFGILLLPVAAIAVVVYYRHKRARDVLTHPRAPKTSALTAPPATPDTPATASHNGNAPQVTHRPAPPDPVLPAQTTQVVDRALGVTPFQPDNPAQNFVNFTTSPETAAPGLLVNNFVMMVNELFGDGPPAAKPFEVTNTFKAEPIIYKTY